MKHRYFRERWLSQATSGQKVDYIIRGQWIIMDALSEIIKMEIKEMAKFTGLDATVAKISDVAEALTTMYSGTIKERDDARSEVAQLKADDAADQGAVDAANERLAVAEGKLTALAAVAAGTPVVLPSAGGAADSSLTG